MGGPVEVMNGTRATVSRLLRRFWWFPQIRRVQQEGLLRAWRRRQRWNRVLFSPAVSSARPDGTSPFEIHLLCCVADYVSAIWALKSLLTRSRVHVPLYLHLQGHSTARMRSTLRQHFPEAVLIPQGEADTHVARILGQRKLHRLRALRDASPIMLKLVDVALFGRAPRLLLLDSDVLFFRAPVELIGAALRRGRAVFQEDIDSCYVLSRAEAADLGVNLQPRLNAGLMVIDRDVIDLDACERFVAHAAFETASGWVEQTLYALLASAAGPIEMLPRTYAVSPAELPTPDMIVARHYSGVSRPYLTSQGIPWLVREGWVFDGSATPRYAAG
jgi:hypothetical protein